MSPLLYRNQNAKALFRQYKKSARRRGLLFELSFEDFVDITQHECYLCGVKPSQVYIHGKRLARYTREPFIYNGIDRCENDIGYVTGNLAASCGTCNMAKRFLNIETFLEYIKRAYKFNFGRGSKGGRKQKITKNTSDGV